MKRIQDGIHQIISPFPEFSREEAKVRGKIRKLGGAIVVMQLLLIGLSLAVLAIYAQLTALPVPGTVLALAVVLVTQLLVSFSGLQRAAVS